MNYKISVLFIILFCISPSINAINPTNNKSFTEFNRINVGGGSEDFALDTVVGNRLLISCDKRREKNLQGSIWAYDLNSTRAQLFPFKSPLGFDFHPHGVSLVSTSEATYLFVINHRTKDATEIDRFIIKNKQLVLDHRFKDIIGTPNDLFSISKDEFYYSDYKTIGGSIIHYNGEYKKIVKHLNYPNGVYIENNTLFYSTTVNGHMYKLDLNTNKKHKLSKIKGADNVMEHSKNELLVTSHPRFIKFIKHYKKSSNKSPSAVYKVNKNNKEKELLFYDDGSIISATSTALFYKNKLYLGQVFDSFILMVE